VNRLILVAAAAAAGAIVLLRPVAPPTVGSGAWSTSTPAARDGRGRHTPAPRALVDVAGYVVRPGVYAVGSEARTRDALALAGGVRPDADLSAVNQAAHLRDGEQIVVPVRGAPRPAAARGHAGRARHPRPRRYERLPAAGIDLNAADAATLATVPGIGPGLAQRIVAFRGENGAFASVDELLDVAGITEHRLDAILPYVVAR
jgi:competence protein ComEA